MTRPFPLLALAVALTLGACDSAETDDALVGAWDLVRAEDASARAAEGQLRLTFDPDGTFRAASCNSGGGRYRTDGDRLRFMAAGFTEIACPGGTDLTAYVLLAQEAETNRYRIEGPTLTVTVGEGDDTFPDVLTFTRAALPE